MANVEQATQLDFNFKENYLSPLETAGFSMGRQYVRDFQENRINHDAWKNISDIHPKFSARILEFSRRLEEAWDRQAKSNSLINPRVEYMQAIYREPKVKDTLKNPFMRGQEAESLVLVNDLLWIRTPYYYTSGLVSDELDRIYGEITPVAILEAEDDSGDVEHPYLPGKTEIIMGILSGKVKLRATYEDLSVK